MSSHESNQFAIRRSLASAVYIRVQVNSLTVIRIYCNIHAHATDKTMEIETHIIVHEIDIILYKNGNKQLLVVVIIIHAWFRENTICHIYMYILFFFFNVPLLAAAYTMKHKA